MAAEESDVRKGWEDTQKVVGGNACESWNEVTGLMSLGAPPSTLI
jgi:hypothetical protein